jgi:hypothetical protein
MHPEWNTWGSAVINQTNPKCPFVTDNDCCQPIAEHLSEILFAPDKTAF